MVDPRNEGRVTVWKERDSQYGKYVTVNFQLNGVEYVCFASKSTSTNPKAPAYSGKIKLKQGQAGGTTTQPQQQTTPPVDPSGDSLPF